MNYFVWEADQYDFTVSALNAYTRSILEQSARGWPGGLRWLHGEDDVPPGQADVVIAYPVVQLTQPGEPATHHGS